MTIDGSLGSFSAPLYLSYARLIHFIKTFLLLLAATSTLFTSDLPRIEKRQAAPTASWSMALPTSSLAHRFETPQHGRSRWIEPGSLQTNPRQQRGDSRLRGGHRASARQVRFHVCRQDDRGGTQEQSASGSPLVRYMEERRDGLRSPMG